MIYPTLCSTNIISHLPTDCFVRTQGMGQGLCAPSPSTHTQKALDSNATCGNQRINSCLPEAWQEGVKDWKLVGISSQKYRLDSPRSNQRIALYGEV